MVQFQKRFHLRYVKNKFGGTEKNNNMKIYMYAVILIPEQNPQIRPFIFSGMSPLMFSVYRNRPLIAKKLVQLNCNMDISGDLRFLAHLYDEPIRFTAIQLAIAFRRYETAAILLEAGCCGSNIEQFLQIRLPYVTPDRARSMLQCRRKVRMPLPQAPRI